MNTYILVITIILGITTMAKIYNVLMDNIKQRTKQLEVCDIVCNIPIAIWGILLLLT